MDEQAISSQNNKEEISVNIPTTNKPCIVIIGGGFAGIELVRRMRSLDANIILIDVNNYHTFQPLLYQVATAGLEPESIAYPFRKIFQGQKNFLFRMAEVQQIVADQNKIKTSIGDVEYDYLIIANGSKNNYFGMKDFQANAMPMKSAADASAIRNQILENMEQALLVKDIDKREALMNIVVIGGGPTGVEMAGALGELKLHVLPHDYPELDLNRMHIHIVDMEDRLLRTMSQEASHNACESLKKFSVNLWLKTKVLAYDGKVLTLSNGKKFLCDTVIWAAGVTGRVLPGIRQESIIANRFKVDAYHKIEGYDNIFALGDVACMASDKMPKGHPMLAPVAIQQAKSLARNFFFILKGQKPQQVFVYKDPGVMTTIGRNRAVVDLPWIKFDGPLAWLTWLFVHLMALVGFRNKLVVFVNWAWNYFSYDRCLRFIFKPSDFKNNS